MNNKVEMTAAIIDGDSYETVHYPDDELRLRASGGGNVEVVEYSSTDRDGPPPHSHLWDEVEYVIEGDVEFWLDGRWHPAGPGSVQMLPAGAAHSVRVPAGEARLLMITIGAPFAPFSRELAAYYATSDNTPAGIVEIAMRHGLRLAAAPTGGEGQ